MTDCLNNATEDVISVATIYSPAKKRYLPHTVRLNNKHLRVTEASFRQLLDNENNLINVYEVIADTGLQLTLHHTVGTDRWCSFDYLKT